LLDSDKYSTDFWRGDSIVVGETDITLSDKQALKDSVLEGGGVSARSYTVARKRRITSQSGATEWLMFELEDPQEVVWLMLKIVGSEIDSRVYFTPPEFEPGSKSDWVKREEFWMFQEPKDPDNIQVDELEYTMGICLGTGELGNESQWTLKPVGAVYGSCQDNDEDKCFAVVAEYYCNNKGEENPEALILEIGGENSDEGGFVTFMLGCSISMVEIDII